MAEGLATVGKNRNTGDGSGASAASDISGALTNAALAGPIFAVLGLVFDQSIDYMENEESCKGLMERVRGLLLAELPKQAESKFVAWAAATFMKTVVAAADFCAAFIGRRSVLQKVGKFFRGKKVQEELTDLHTELNEAQEYMQTSLQLTIHAKLSDVKTVLDTLVEDFKKRTDDLTKLVEAKEKNIIDVLGHKLDELLNINKEIQGRDYHKASAAVSAAMEATQDVIAQSPETRMARARFDTLYHQCATHLSQLNERAGVTHTDARTANGLAVARWVEANGAQGFEAASSFRRAARELLRLAQDFRRILTDSQLAESGNIFCACAPLDAANWKRIKKEVAEYQRIRLTSYGHVLALLASPDNNDERNLSVVADFMKYRDPYNVSDLDVVVNEGREFVRKERAVTASEREIVEETLVHLKKLLQV